MPGKKKNARGPRKPNGAGNPEMYVVRRLRLLAELTQAQLAKKAGVSERTIRTWETTGIPRESDSPLLTRNTRQVILETFQGILELSDEDREAIENENKDRRRKRRKGR